MEKPLFIPDHDRAEAVYKKQGDGSKEFPFADSWIVSYFKGSELVHKDIVFKDPEKPDTEQAEKAVDQMDEKLLTSLWTKLIDHMDKLPVELLDELAKKIPEKKQANPK